MKYILAILSFIISINTAISQTSRNVVSHNKVTIVTNPKKGTNSFKQWAIFPTKTHTCPKVLKKQDI